MSGSVIPTPMPETAADEAGQVARLPMIDGHVVDPAEVAAEVEMLSAEATIAWALERFHRELRFAVSFQKTSSVMVDMAHRIDPGARFFYVDTGLLFPQTYDDPRRARRALRDRVRPVRRSATVGAARRARR